jgi:hypothetical protein
LKIGRFTKKVISFAESFKIPIRGIILLDSTLLSISKYVGLDV